MNIIFGHTIPHSFCLSTTLIFLFLLHFGCSGLSQPHVFAGKVESHFRTAFKQPLTQDVIKLQLCRFWSECRRLREEDRQGVGWTIPLLHILSSKLDIFSEHFCFRSQGLGKWSMLEQRNIRCLQQEKLHWRWK